MTSNTCVLSIMKKHCLNFRNKILIIQNGKSDDPTTKSIKSTCTEFSAKKMIEQYELSNKSTYKITKTHHFVLQSNRNVYNAREIDLPNGDSARTCDCSFYLQNQMQCRHLFYINSKYFQKENQFDERIVARRWKKNFDAFFVNLIDSNDFQPITIPIIDSVEALANTEPENPTSFNDRLRFLQT